MMDDLNNELYQIRGKLITLISENIDCGISSYIKKYKTDIRYFLHYPLIQIELGLDADSAESVVNSISRDVFGFLVQRSLSEWSECEYKSTISKKGFNCYKDKNSNILRSLCQDNRTLMEVKDGNSYAKSIIEKIDSKRFKLITSLVTDIYKEESFYFYGVDNQEDQKAEKQFILQNTIKFFDKYLLNIDNIEKLTKNIDYELLEYCKDRVMIDLMKLHTKTKSKIFNSLDELGGVLSFLYYLAFVKSLKRKLILMFDQADRHFEECLLQFSKEWAINIISDVYNINDKKVTKVIDYLINTGYPNILEFPLFEHHGMIITSPSLIMINDWAFTIINGHYIKKIDFVKREKTISISTEKKLEETLNKVTNILYCKEQYYEFFDGNGEKINSDIDFAIFDYKNNIVLVIESKWKDNHYYCGDEKNHVKIQDTLNKIFKEQIEKHKIFLSDIKNICDIFSLDDSINLQNKKLDIHYLAVDKRNQLHLDNKHMITEYMLLFFIKENIENNTLNLCNVVNKINQMYTNVEYISIEPTFEISLDNDTVIMIDDADLTLRYSFK
jgi:hypothetical protein